MKNEKSYIDVAAAKKIYSNGENVMQYLKNNAPSHASLSDIIEVAYDMQAGTYIDYVLNNQKTASVYWEEEANILESYISSPNSMLDIGTGEITTLSGVLNTLKPSASPKHVYAFDISWSRLKKGLSYLEKNKNFDANLTTFVADIGQIPLPSNSIDVITSNHALEPNGAQQKKLMKELFRVAKHRMMLFEPCYEINTDEGKRRMEKHGYIRDLDSTIKELGGILVDRITMKHPANPLNPTACFVIDVPTNHQDTNEEKPSFTVPGTDFLLEDHGGFFYSEEVGLSFPILKGIPILQKKYGIVSTAMLD